IPPRSDCFSKQTISGTSTPARRAASKARSWARPLGPAPRTAIRWVMLDVSPLVGTRAHGARGRPAAAGCTRWTAGRKSRRQSSTGALLRSCRYRAWTLRNGHRQTKKQERPSTGRYLAAKARSGGGSYHDPPPASAGVGDPVWHVPGGHVQARRINVVQRVVEEDVGAEGLQEGTFRAPAQEQRLVKPHSPLAQGADDPLVRGRRAGGDQRRADRRRIAGWICRLQVMQGGQETAERPPRERLPGPAALMLVESIDSLELRHPLAFIAE